MRLTQPDFVVTPLNVLFLDDTEVVMGDDILAVLTNPTVDVALAGRVLGIGKNAAYKAREAGDIPSLKIGGRFRVPTSKLREMLGLPSQGPTPSEA